MASWIPQQVFDHDNKGAITPTQFRRTVEAVMPGVSLHALMPGMAVVHPVNEPPPPQCLHHSYPSTLHAHL